MIDLKYIDALKTTPGGYNDIEITADGDIATIDGYARVKQDVVKIILTETGLMPYPNYGSSLPSMSGNTPYDTTLLNTVANEVISDIHYLVNTETSQQLSEQISDLKSLDVSYSNSQIQVGLVLLTKDNTEVAVGFSV